MSSSDELLYKGFTQSQVSSEGIISRLRFAKDNRVLTGVRVIDDVFGGILPNDIVLLGAKTGAGKTALASAIALNNTLSGKRVYMFALEAEPEEIEMRILYEMVVGKARAHDPRAKYNYKHWRLGRYKGLDTYLEDALNSVDHFKNFNIYYRKKEFGIDEFVKETMAIKDRADLIIVDHIHYFDLSGDNENRALSDAVKRIRDVALLTGVPIILLAHLRKSANVVYKLVPDIDDFMGSSDLTKVCTKAIIIAPRGNKKDSVDTLFYFPKFRGFSAPSRYLFSSPYDIYQNKYSEGYSVYDFKYNNVNFKFAENLVDGEELSWLG